MLTQAQINEYNDVGAIVVPDVLTPAEVRTLSDRSEEHTSELQSP